MFDACEGCQYKLFAGQMSAGYLLFVGYLLSQENE